MLAREAELKALRRSWIRTLFNSLKKLDEFVDRARPVGCTQNVVLSTRLLSLISGPLHWITQQYRPGENRMLLVIVNGEGDARSARSNASGRGRPRPAEPQWHTGSVQHFR